MNKIILTGNLTKDPDVRYTQSGKTVARTGIAVMRNFKNADGERDADFFNLIAWDKTAEFFGKYLHKGSKILVEGRLQNNNYTDDKGVTDKTLSSKQWNLSERKKTVAKNLRRVITLLVNLWTMTMYRFEEKL